MTVENISICCKTFLPLKYEWIPNYQNTRKCPLRGHCLAPPGKRQRIMLKREKIFGTGGITDNGITDYVTDGQTDVEFEIVF